MSPPPPGHILDVFALMCSRSLQISCCGALLGGACLSGALSWCLSCCLSYLSFVVAHSVAQAQARLRTGQTGHHPLFCDTAGGLLLPLAFTHAVWSVEQNQASSISYITTMNQNWAVVRPGPSKSPLSTAALWMAKSMRAA
jgi:hypothetical protein